MRHLKKVTYSISFLILFSCHGYAEVDSYPWYLNLDTNHSDQDGVVGDFNFQQAVSWKMMNSEVEFQPFVELGLIKSSQQNDYWNNVIKPAVGFKFHFEQYNEGKVKWREMDFGVRHIKFNYTGRRIDDDQEDNRTEIFFNLYTSGEW